MHHIVSAALHATGHNASALLLGKAALKSLGLYALLPLLFKVLHDAFGRFPWSLEIPDDAPPEMAMGFR